MTFDDTTINGWLLKSGPINLRHTERKRDTHHDLRAAGGIILSTLIGGNIVLWVYIFVRWFT